MANDHESLFSYGTLRTEAVQRANFGRVLQGKADILVGYKIVDVEITDPRVLAESSEKIHPGLVYTGEASDNVPGIVFALTGAELEKADHYEVKDYQRVCVVLKLGQRAWAYVLER